MVHRLPEKLREREAATGWSSENCSNGVENCFRRSAAAALGEMGQPQPARSREERQQSQGKTTTEPTTKSDYILLRLMGMLATSPIIIQKKLNPSFFKFEHWRISTVWISHIIRLGQYISKFVTYTQFVEPIPIIINRRISLKKRNTHAYSGSVSRAKLFWKLS